MRALALGFALVVAGCDASAPSDPLAEIDITAVSLMPAERGGLARAAVTVSNKSSKRFSKVLFDCTFWINGQPVDITVGLAKNVAAHGLVNGVAVSEQWQAETVTCRATRAIL